MFFAKCFGSFTTFLIPFMNTYSHPNTARTDGRVNKYFSPDRNNKYFTSFLSLIDIDYSDSYLQ